MYNTPVLCINLYGWKMRAFILLLICCFSCLNSSVYSVTQDELLEYAISQNDEDLLEAVFKYPGSQSDPSLNLAMHAKDYFAVFMFIEYGIDINSRRECLGENLSDNKFRIGQGKTILESAIGDSEIALVEYFLLKGADPTIKRNYYEGIQGFNTKTNYVTTAVHDVIVQNRLDVMDLFVEYGFDLSKICYEIDSPPSKKPYKMTPIQVAIFHNRREMVALLLSAGVEI